MTNPGPAAGLPPSPAPRWVLWTAAAAASAAFLLVLVDVSLWHPGYAYGDERNLICWLQDLREGAGLPWRFGRGCLSLRELWGWSLLGGASLETLHTPQLVNLAVEWLALALVVRRWFGDEAAAWAVIAVSVSAQTWIQARSLLAFQALPVEALLLAWAAGRVRGWCSAAAWGCAAAFLLYEYDGAFIAVPAVWLACVALDPGFRRWGMASATAFGVLAVAVVLRERSDLPSYAAARLGATPGAGAGADWKLRLMNFASLVKGGVTLPYFGVSGWPAWPWWTWPGLAAGVWALRRSAGIWLAAWVLGAAFVTQWVTTNYGLPLHRLASAVPALAALSGLGLSRLRLRLGRSAWLLVLLLVLGAASEGWAWTRQEWTFAPELYARCRGLEEVRAEFGTALADPGVRVLTQLDGLTEADARFVLGRSLPDAGPSPVDPSVPAPSAPGSASRKVLAIVPASYARALGPKSDDAAWIWEGRGLEPILVLTAQGPEAARLCALEDTLLPLVGKAEDDMHLRRERALAYLNANPNGDAWAWTAALQADYEAASRSGGAGASDLAFLARRRPLSGAPFMVLARACYKADPMAGLAYARSAATLEPRDGEALLMEAACLRALGNGAWILPQQQWKRLRESGEGWRHTQ